jgi:hypothetical protein
MRSPRRFSAEGYGSCSSLVTLPFFMVSVFAGYYLPSGFSKRTFNNVVSLLLLVIPVSIIARCVM